MLRKDSVVLVYLHIYYVVLKILNTHSSSHVLLIENGSFRRYKPRRSEVLISFYYFPQKISLFARERNRQNIYICAQVKRKDASKSNVDRRKKKKDDNRVAPVPCLELPNNIVRLYLKLPFTVKSRPYLKTKFLIWMLQ